MRQPAKYILLTCFSLAALVAPEGAFAAKKGLKASPEEIFSVTLANGKALDCLERKGGVMPGTAKTKKGKTRFFPEKDKYRKALAALEQQKNNLGPKKYKKKKKALKDGFNDKVVACGGGGVDPYTSPLTFEDVTYLYRKAAFAAEASDYNACVGKRADVCVDHLMRYDANADRVFNEATRWLDENYDEGSYEPDREVSRNGLQMAILHILLNTPNQYQAKLGALFLHHHFAASYDILGDDWSKHYLAWRYMTKLLRAGNDGNYRKLVSDMFHDELQQIWLDGAKNTRFSPNQNLGREFFELWTLGPVDLQGNKNYSEENDIIQISRAFTGYDVTEVQTGPDRYDWSLAFTYQAFDPGAKTLWPGLPQQQTVTSADDVISATLDSNPQAPVHLAQRILSRYLTQTPPPALVNALARVVKQNDYNLHATMKKLLTSKTFYSAVNRGALMRESSELLVGTLRSLKDRGFPVELVRVRWGVEDAGQVLGSPPTVFGWATDRWANAQERLNLFNNFISHLRRDFELDEAGFSYLDLLNDLPAADRLSEDKVLAHLERMFGVKFPEEHRAQILEYMNNDRNWDGDLERVRWDPTEERARLKIPGILLMIFQYPAFQMK